MICHTPVVSLHANPLTAFGTPRTVRGAVYVWQTLSLSDTSDGVSAVFGSDGFSPSVGNSVASIGGGCTCVGRGRGGLRGLATGLGGNGPSSSGTITTPFGTDTVLIDLVSLTGSGASGAGLT